MEQPSDKKARVILAAGLAASLALAAAQYLSPVSGAIWRGHDVGVAALGERSDVLLVYRPSAGAVNSYSFVHARPRSGSDPRRRAADLARQAGSLPDSDRDEVFFVEVSSAPDLEALLGPLNGWRNRPSLFVAAASWARRLGGRGATNISGFDRFVLFSDFSGLAASDFVLTEASRQAAMPALDAGGETGPAPLVEVFNASGRRGLAERAARRLRALGFDVITVASYRRREAGTRILGFSADNDTALRLRSALGLEGLEIRVDPAQKSVAGAAVVLGADFDEKSLK